jgi:hypothetical protein
MKAIKGIGEFAAHFVTKFVSTKVHKTLWQAT